MGTKIGISFSHEREKIKDLKILTKEDFLSSYSYLTENDYFSTIKELSLKGSDLVEKLFNRNARNIHQEAKILLLEYSNTNKELEILIEKYLNENTSLEIL